MTVTCSRRGTVLIIVAGISALMASMALAFLTRMRSDAEESLLTVREAQAHIMLVAACNYIQEASRLGYDNDPDSPYHKEAYGWIDVRDGTIGPKASALPPESTAAYSFGANDPTLFPLEKPYRFQMEVMEIPPFAISLAAAPNAIIPTSPHNGAPWQLHEDPMPVLSLSKGNTFEKFERGIPAIRSNSSGLAWFRLYRLGGTKYGAKYNAATFIVTCGAGGTKGFRDWAEVPGDERSAFMGDPGYFESLRFNECRLWYLVEWSPAVGGMIYHNTKNDRVGYDQYGIFPVNGAQDNRSQGHAKNFAGTMRLVERLPLEPEDW